VCRLIARDIHMRALRLLVVALVGAAACACASVEPLPLAPSPDPAPSGAPQPVEGYDWYLGEEDDALWLGYGLADSDDIWLAMTCLRGSGRMELEQHLDMGPDRAVVLESGGETERWPARGEYSEMLGGDILIAEVPTDHPVFLRFRRLGWMAANGQKARVTMAAHPGSPARIERFFTACG
jgi:hypothetical protein